MNTSEDETWDLAFIRDYIKNHQNKSDSDKKFLTDVVNSMARYVIIFRYHGSMIYKYLDSDFSTDKVSEIERFKLVAGISEYQERHEHAKIASDANFISAVHTTRNIYDIFSQIINGLLEHAIPVNRCDIHGVTTKLEPSLLKERLEELRSSHWFKYVETFSNTVKHRILISSIKRVVLHQNEFGLRVSAFNYGDKSYDEYWIKDALNGVQEVLNSIIHCGIALNGQLSESK